MTAFGPRLGAKERYPSAKAGKIQALRNVAIAHQLKKRFLVGRPVLRGAVRIANFWTGCEARFVRVGNSRDAVQEKREVRKFGEAGKLADAILADVNQLLHAGLLEEGEEFFRGFSRKADGADGAFHRRP